jgi:hypothetical protein
MTYPRQGKSMTGRGRCSRLAGGHEFGTAWCTLRQIALMATSCNSLSLEVMRQLMEYDLSDLAA